MRGVEPASRGREMRGVGGMGAGGIGRDLASSVHSEDLGAVRGCEELKRQVEGVK